MTRYETMHDLLNKGRFFKLVCGAGNEDAENVRRLVIIYTLAGAMGFDVSATPSVVRACINGINTAFDLAPELSKHLVTRPFVTVSVGMQGDHHVRKAFIVDNCVKCGKCITVCPTDAIPENFVVIRERCIGCGNCEAVCPPKVSAIRYQNNDRALEDILPACLEAGAENIELHAAVSDNDAILDEWKLVNKILPDHFVSMCLDRSHLSDTHLLERIKQAWEIAGDRLIIQADGVPMGGSDDSYNTTLQAVAIAEVIQKKLISRETKYKDIKILLSGGTNSKTPELARMCKVPWSGISIGTYARNIIKPFLSNSNFDNDIENMRKAVNAAEGLVNACMRM